MNIFIIYFLFLNRKFRNNLLILATNQTNTKKHIENIPKEIDCDKVS